MITIHDYDTPSAKTWNMVIQGMRNSWESWEKSDSDFYEPVEDYVGVFILGDKDKELALRLIRAGTDHGKFLSQLPIVVDFTAPEYFMKEFDTYKVGTRRNSTSMMHTLGREEFNAGMFSWEDVSEHKQLQMLLLLNDARSEWDSYNRKKGPNAESWRAMIQLVPQSWNYRSMWSANYQVLRAMYHARKNHRLKEWRDFCAWIETLPFSDLITALDNDT